MVGAFGGVLVLLWMGTQGVDQLDQLKQTLERLLSWLRDRPLLLFSATAILPGLGLPVSPFLVACGAVGIPRYGIVMTCIFAVLAIAVCMIWNYWVARYLFRGFFSRFLASKEHLLPEGKSGNFLFLAFLIRITPGIPLVVQNYFLGFSKMPFRKYLWVSMVVQIIYTPAYVVTGGALIEGNFLLLGVALLIIVFLSAVTYVVRHRLEKSKSP